MALSRINRCPDLLNTFNRCLQPVIANYGINEIQGKRRETVPKSRVKSLHVTSVRCYPDAPTLSLPNNVSEIFANETGRFTPERARDIATPILIYGTNRAANSSNADNSSSFSFLDDKKLAFNGQRNFSIVQEDTHVDSYDCSGAVSLNGSMQSNVPKPFCSTGKSTHFNMPGGQWAKDSKYIAENMQKSHYRLTRVDTLLSNPVKNGIIYTSRMVYSTNVSATGDVNDPEKNKKEESIIVSSRREAFKQLIRDYGKVAFVFYIGISLISLGTCYTIIISGVDLKPYFEKFLDMENEEVIRYVNNSSEFILAYFIHKLTAPIRMGITCSITPLIVKYLRKKGIYTKIVPKKQ